MVFGQKQNTDISPAPGSKPKVEPYEIHTMPVKFHKYLSVKKRGLGKYLLIALIILVVIGLLSFGVYYFMNRLSQQQIIANTNKPANINTSNQNVNQVNANINVNANTNVNANENLNTNVNANENVNANTNANENINVNVNANENVNTNINAPVQPEISYSTSLDSDSDKLTDVEEDLYTTEKRKPDTDSDGFIDGLEVMNGFNPKAAGSSTLVMSGLVNVYQNQVYKYEIQHPSDWLAKPTDQSMTDVIFQSTTGEFIQVLIEDNIDKLDLVQWYLKQSPDADLNLLKRETTKNGLDALISPDRLTYYLADKADLGIVYVITYNIGNKTRINFETTFAMMINSFKLVPAPPVVTPPAPTPDVNQ